MARKILLFLSTLRKDTQENEYTGIDGTVVTGTQSNEAPVKYLLHCYPDISEIICVVTEEARQTAWEWFGNKIREEKPDIQIVDIPCEGEDSKTFIAGPMPKILERVKSGDEILLDTTGGFRNAVTYMLLITRILSYSEIPVTAAVYSNYSKHQIEDLSDTMGLFDLVEGMQELTSFGAINSIRQYYENAVVKDEKIEKMLQAVEELTETITLCRTASLDEKMKQFNDAMREAEQSSDPLFRQMLTAFKEKFGGEWNVLSILKWCVESGMIQQALTVYTERIPTYIMQRGFLRLKESADREKLYLKANKQEYEDGNAVLFMRDFLALSRGIKSVGVWGKLTRFQALLKDPQKQSAIAVYAGLPGKAENFSMKDICEDEELETGLRNTVIFLKAFYYHGEPRMIENALGEFRKKYPALAGAEMIQWIKERKNTWPRTIEKVLNCLAGDAGRNVAAVLLEMSREDMETLRKDKVVLTLEKMEILLPNSDYQITCSNEKMRQVAMDYLYVKQLRNMANHANGESIGEGSELLEYLYKKGYPNLEQTSVKKIAEIIRDGIMHIEGED